MEIVKIDSTNINLVYQFLKNKTEISHHFRYFDKRDPLQTLYGQIYTIIGLDSKTKEPIAYGHIDYENTYWLGVCIHTSQCGKGYGKEIIKNLLDYVDNNFIRIQLSVDSDNLTAIHLYKKFGFVETKRTDSVIFMKR